MNLDHQGWTCPNCGNYIAGGLTHTCRGGVPPTPVTAHRCVVAGCEREAHSLSPEVFQLPVIDLDWGTLEKHDGPRCYDLPLELWLCSLHRNEFTSHDARRDYDDRPPS